MKSKDKSKDNKTVSPLGYRDEEDRTYGLAGMAIAAASLNAIDRVALVTLDTDGPMVVFSNEYYYPGSQSASPKATWHRLMENFQITSAMAISNVLSRRMVHERSGDLSDLLDPLREAIAAEGAEVCELEKDEADRIFHRTLSYSQRIFGNSRLLPYIDEFAGILARRRTLTGREIMEELTLLQMI